MTDRTVPPAAEADVAAAWDGCDPGEHLARLKADPELATEWEAEWADNWDCFDSTAYQARIEAGLEPEAEP